MTHVDCEAAFRRMHPQYRQNRYIWERSRDAFAGGETYIRQALIKHISEIDLEFEERLVTLRMWRDNSLNKNALPDEFLEFLAGNISSNVRRLKGCFLRLSAALEMSGRDDFSIADAEELLHAQLAEENASRDIRPESIQQMVARHFGVSVPDIIGSRRTRQIAEPRMVAMYLCREMMGLSLTRIGDAFGGRHYTTVMSSIDKVEQSIKQSPSLASLLDDVRRMIKDSK